MPASLLAECLAARDRGADFPTIYQTVIRKHPLFAGVPTTATDGKAIWLEVGLRSGQKLIYRSTENEFSLSSRA